MSRLRSVHRVFWDQQRTAGFCSTRLSRKNYRDAPMASSQLRRRWRSRFPLALRFDNLHLTGLAVIARFVQLIIVPIARHRIMRPAVEHAAVRRNAFTDKVLPLVAIVVSVGLAVSYDYRCIFLVRCPNYFSDCFDRDHRGSRASAYLALLPNHSPG